MNLSSIIIFFAGTLIINAQSDSLLNKKTGKDSNKSVLTNNIKLPAKDFMIQEKDLELIKPAEGMKYIFNGDTLTFSKEEVESELSIEKLRAIRRNRDSSLAYIKPETIDEEKEYPALFHFRKILGVSKSIAFIIILLLSIF